MKRRAFGILAAVLPFAACQQDQQPATGAAPAVTPIAGGSGRHWLIGTWRGALVGMRGGDNRATLVVTSVDASGNRASGRWGGTDIDIRISGTTIRFFTGNNNPAELTYQQPSTLVGEVTNSLGGGRQGASRWSITMQRA